MPSIESHITAAIDLRHRLHRIPELGFQEHETAAAIRTELDRLGIAYVPGPHTAPTATIALIGNATKPCVALRADIDALPISEATGVSYASTHPGRMHACGHDGHTSILMAAAAVLQDIADDLPVCVKFIWQPAEEGGGGGEKLVQAGVLDGRIGPQVAAIFGLHGWPGLPVGVVATKPGALLANTDSFAATFTGKGCHGAFPHLGRDPIVAVADAVLNLQGFVSREMDPTEAAVITVGILRAGTATNIIPDTATLEGTARTLTPASRAAVQQSIRRRLAGVAAANDVDVTLAWTDGYPATINDPAMADYVACAAKKVVGGERYFLIAKPSMGGEDFSYYLQQVPGCFFLIGVDTPGATAPHAPLHSDRFDFPDNGIEVGVRMFVELARRFENHG